MKNHKTKDSSVRWKQRTRNHLRGTPQYTVAYKSRPSCHPGFVGLFSGTMSATNGVNDTHVRLNDFCNVVEVIDRSSFSSDGERIKALAAAYRLIGRLETPWDTVARLCMTEVGQDI